jgi:colanic acid biosynthesis glycosyl transferase WcaI
MRILYVSQYFPPEMGAPAARVHELSREWARLGHRVTVLTAFAHHPLGIKAPADRWRLTRREQRDGIDVVRAYIYAAPNQGTARRMASYASFMLAAVPVGALRVPRPEIVVATTPQLLCACAGYALARFFRVPFVLEVRDLWPESVLAVGAMSDNFIIRGLKRTARFLYEHSDRIVTVGQGYANKIHELYGLPLAAMDIVTNGIDASLFRPGPRDNSVRREYGWGDRFVVMYVGTHGMAHALDKVLETAERLREREEVRFVFVGEGAEKDGLKRRAAELGLPNVEFIDQQPKERVVEFYAACDLGLVTLRDTPLFQEVLPSKIFEYLGMERPILISVEGQARQVAEASGAGEFVAPEDPEAMAQAILRLAGQREQLRERGRQGRRFVLENYDRSALARKYLTLLEGLIRGGPAPASRCG